MIMSILSRGHVAFLDTCHLLAAARGGGGCGRRLLARHLGTHRLRLELRRGANLAKYYSVTINNICISLH